MLARLIRYYFFVIILLFSLIFLADFIFQRDQLKNSDKSIDNTFPALIELVQHFCTTQLCDESTLLPTNSLRFIDIHSLALPKAQSDRMNKNERIAVSDGENTFLYQKISASLILEVGPIGELSNNTSHWYSIAFYTIIGLAFLFVLWPLYSDIWRIKHATEKFACTKDLASLTMPKSRFFKPVTDTINWMLHKIARLLAFQNELSGTLSHELRTNLSRLKFTLAEISESNLEESTQLLKQDVNEIQSLVDQYLNFSKSEHEEPELSLSWVTLSGLVQTYLDQLGVYSRKTYAFDIKQDPVIFADTQFLSRAIKNLIDNAFKYGNRQVKVTLFEQQQQLVLMVEDDGEGLVSSTIEDLFLPYTRKNQDKVGYGLGLAITKKVVEWHNGEIVVSNSKELGGACFKLLIPIKASN